MHVSRLTQGDRNWRAASSFRRRHAYAWSRGGREEEARCRNVSSKCPRNLVWPGWRLTPTHTHTHIHAHKRVCPCNAASVCAHEMIFPACVRVRLHINAGGVSSLGRLRCRNAEGILFKRAVFKEQRVSKGDGAEGSQV